MRRIALVALAAVVCLTLPVVAVRAQDDDDDDEYNPAVLAKALTGVTITLQQGLTAAQASGTPISAKFEVEDGKLQLSVYTMKGDKFFEVVVDHKTGKVSATEAITDGHDLAAAKKQAEAMAKTKVSLREFVAKAEKANAGFVAVSIVAAMEDGAAQAHVSLLKGVESKEIREKL
jgi:hypothetical protein